MTEEGKKHFLKKKETYTSENSEFKIFAAQASLSYYLIMTIKKAIIFIAFFSFLRNFFSLHLRTSLLTLYY